MSTLIRERERERVRNGENERERKTKERGNWGERARASEAMKGCRHS